MASNASQSDAFPNDGYDDNPMPPAGNYTPCNTLYVETPTDTYRLSDVTPAHRIDMIKEIFINLLLRRKLIPHHLYECAFSYENRELDNHETLESCQIGNEARVHAIFWEDDPNSSVAPTSGGKRSKRVRSTFDSLESKKDSEKTDIAGAPATKKQKSVRFDLPPPRQPSTSRTSNPQDYMMSAGLGPGDKPLEFHDPCVRDNLPRRSSLEEVPQNTRSKLPPLPYNMVPPRSEIPKHNYFSHPPVSPENTRGTQYRDDYYKNINEILPNRGEYGSYPTAVRLTPQSSDVQQLTSNSLPSVPNTTYMGPRDTGPASRSVPFSAAIGSLNPFYNKTLPPPIHKMFPRTQQAPSPSLFQDPPQYTTPRSTIKPSSGSSPEPRQPSSNFQLLEPYSSPSSPQPSGSPAGSPSTLQSLNPYFSNTSPPPPKYPPSPQTSLRSSSNSPQPTNQNSMTYDYFQAARSNLTPSQSPPHPLNSPLSPPPPHINVKPPSPNLAPYSHRPPPADRSDRSPSSSPIGDPQSKMIDLEYRQSETSSNPNSKSKPHSNAPNKQSPPLISRPNHSPHPHPLSPFLSPPPSPRRQKQKYQLPHIPLFYKYDLSPPESSLLAPEPTPTPAPTPAPTAYIPLTSSSEPPTRQPPTKLKSPIYYSSQNPLPQGFSLKGAIVIPSLAHEILPKEFLAFRTVRQLIKIQGWEMKREEWWGVRRVLEREVDEDRKKRRNVDVERGARGNLEVLIRGLMVEWGKG